MTPNAEKTSRSSLTNWLLPLSLAVLLVGGGLWLWREGVLRLISNHDRLIALLREDGMRGPLLCIAMQFIQVVIFVIPGEITQIAGGLVFGAWEGFLFSVIGIVLGSAFNFCFARIVGRPTLERFISRPTLERIDKLLNSTKGRSALFLLFLLPGAPKDAMCYGAGFTKINLVEFVIVTGLARSPALFASILIGAHASTHNYRSLVLTGLVLVLAVAGYYLYERHRDKTKQPS
jgi:uncharacterized membrane protein YdjX (TVP38/TMEM64 family)